MNASVSNDDLLRFVDGALDDHGRVRVLTHLAAHPAAVGRVEAYLHQSARLRALREHLPLADSKDFAAPLQAVIVEQLGRSRRRRGWRRMAAVAAVAVAVASGAVGLASQSWRGGADTAFGKTVTPTLQPYFLFGGHELGTTIEPVVDEAGPPAIDLAAFAWLAERSADMRLTAPDLGRLGLELMGGAVLDQQGAPAIRAVYRDAAGKLVALFAGIGKPDARHAFWLEREGYVSLQWRRGAMIFALVAPTDSPELSQIVELVGSAVARIPVTTAPEPAIIQAPGQAQAHAEPPPAVAGVVEPSPAEAGPVQSIAVPLARPTIAVAPPPADDPEVLTIHPDDLRTNAGSNAPEPL